jgi:hypothetical protein
MLLFYGNIEDENGNKLAYKYLRDDINGHFYSGIFNLGSLACGNNLTQFLNNLQGLAGQAPLLTTPGEFGKLKRSIPNFQHFQHRLIGQVSLKGDRVSLSFRTRVYILYVRPLSRNFGHIAQAHK